MAQPDLKAKALTPERLEKTRESLRAFWANDTPQTQEMRRALVARNAMQDPEVRAKVSASLKRIGHRPPLRGGNGTGLTEPQRLLLEMLGSEFQAEYSIPTGAGRKKGGLPTHYCVDLAHPELKIVIEVDGASHRLNSRRLEDQRRDECLTALGWTVLRFSNQAILDSVTTVAAAIQSTCTTLRSRGILPSP